MTFYLNPRGEFYLVNLPVDLNELYKPLFNCILNKSLGSVLSVTFTDKEVSMILTTDLYNKYFRNYTMICDNIYSSESYKGFLVTTKNPGLNEVGLLSKLTNIFSENGISILTLSTYLGNYIFYPSDFEQNFKKMLEENKDVMIHSLF